MGRWMIHGETVTLIERTEGTSTSNGFSSYTDKAYQIDNVLIGSPQSSDYTAENLYEQTPNYCLCIPKGDTHKWIGSYVKFWNDTWKVLGVPTKTVDDLTPGPWNMKVMVAKADIEVTV